MIESTTGGRQRVQSSRSGRWWAGHLEADGQRRRVVQDEGGPPGSQSTQDWPRCRLSFCQEFKVQQEGHLGPATRSHPLSNPSITRHPREVALASRPAAQTLMYILRKPSPEATRGWTLPPTPVLAQMRSPSPREGLVSLGTCLQAQPRHRATPQPTPKPSLDSEPPRSPLVYNFLSSEASSWPEQA